MAVTEEKDGALATAAVAAAAGVAAYGLRKALTGNGGGTSLVPGRNDEDDDDEGGEERAGGGLVRGGSVLSTVWDSAASSLLPLAEQAAEAAGKWTAENAPDVVRDEIVPRFIEAFNDAAQERETGPAGAWACLASASVAESEHQLTRPSGRPGSNSNLAMIPGSSPGGSSGTRVATQAYFSSG
jgi:hypothetical protein